MLLDHEGFETIKHLHGAASADHIRNFAHKVSRLVSPVLEQYSCASVRITPRDAATLAVAGTLPACVHRELLFLLNHVYEGVYNEHCTPAWYNIVEGECIDTVLMFLPWALHPPVTFNITIPCKREQPKMENCFPPRVWHKDADVLQLMQLMQQKLDELENCRRKEPVPASVYDDPWVIRQPPVCELFVTKKEWLKMSNIWLQDATNLILRNRSFRPREQSPPGPVAIETPSHAFVILGLSPNHDLTDTAGIKRAWKRMSLRAHPDKGGTKEHQQRVNMARDFLMEMGILRPTSRFS